MSYLLCLILGVLTALPMAINELFILPWICLAVTFFILPRHKKYYLHGFLFSLGYYVVVFHWFVELYPMDFAGFDEKSAIALIIVAITFMSTMQALGTAFVFMIYGRLKAKINKWLLPFVGGCLWVIAEYGQTQFWYGVPWGKLALTQVGFLPSVQSASLFGSYFIAFLIVAIGCLLALGFENILSKEGKKIAIKPVAVALALMMLNVSFGLIYMNAPSDESPKTTVAAVQGNISSTDKWADNSLQNSLEIYSTLTKEAVEESGAKLVVWPETVITTSLNVRTATSNKISNLAKELNCSICVGAYYTEYDEDDNSISYNSVYLYRADGTVDENVYKKRHLVPFGEFIPERKIILTVFPFLGEMNMFKSELGRGESTSLMTNGEIKIGSLVCFDSIYPELARSSTYDGAEILTLSTNDSWYGDSAAVYEHNNHSVLRAIENGRAIVRAANTGVSSVIDGNGNILSYKEPLVSGYTYASVSTDNNETLYTKIGDVLVYASFALVIGAIGYAIVNDIIKKKKHG